MADGEFRSTQREIRAAGPTSDPERLRAAYLDLLKLSLCDLTGPSSTSVIWNANDPVHSRELAGDDLQIRAGGEDWPLHGLSMIGLDRLDDLQSAVESLVADGIEGDLIEAGSWRGGATILMRATLDSLGSTERTVYVCDSFQGFPTQDDEFFPEDPKLAPLDEIDFLSAELEDVRANFARFGCDQGVEFVKGFFEDTLPALPPRSYALVRLDGDTYEATWLGLETLYPQLVRGGYIVIDDYSFIDACRRAVDDFREQHGIAEPIEKIDWNGIRWRRETDPVAPAPGSGDSAPRIRTEGAAPRDTAASAREHRDVPTLREVELARELEATRKHLADVEKVLDHFRGSPLAGPAAWFRARTNRT